MTKTIGFALIGSGGAAGIHAQAIKDMESARLTGVYSADMAAAARFSEKYGVKNYHDTKSLYSDDDADVAVICTPSGLHAKLAIEAMQHGKNVVIEKPMALSYEDCQKIMAVEKTSGKICAVISQLRYSDGVIAAKHAIQSGQLGRIVLGDVHMRYYRSPEYYSQSNWRGTWKMDGGGALMNQGIHGIDILLHLMGGIKSVCALSRTLVHDIQTEDTAVAVIEFNSGAVGTMEATTSVFPGYARQMNICGSLGSISLEENNITKWDISLPRPQPSADAIGGHNDPAALSSLYHRMQLTEIAGAVRGENRLSYTSADAAEAVRFICGVYQSSKNNKTVYFD